MSRSSTSNNAGATETQPLLGSSQETLGGRSEISRGSRIKSFVKRALPEFETTSPRFRFVPLLGCLLILVSESEWCFKQVALFRAIEAMFCIEYYQEHDPALAKLGRGIPEKLCKADSIQKNVANVSAMIMFLRMSSATIGTIFLGYVADKYGRWIVLLLHRTNNFVYSLWTVFVYLAFPLLPAWTISLGAVTGLIGGNFDVCMTMLFSSYTDVVADPVQRSKLFYWTNSMQYAAQLVIPLLGGLLMNLDGKGGTPHISMLVSTGTSLLSVLLVAFFFPETMDKTTEAVKDDDEDSVDPKKVSFKQRIRTRLVQIGSVLEGIGGLNMTLISLSLFVASTGIKSIEWFGVVQYPVIKLHWTFPQASTIISAEAAVTLINFSVITPKYTSLGASYGLSNATTSMMIMLWSCLLLLVGSLCIGLSANNATFLGGILIYTLGSGFTIATQAYVADLIDRKRIARVLSIISILIILGKLAASGIFPKLLSVGLDTGIEWMKGLPILVATALFTLAAMQLGTLGMLNKGWKKQDLEERSLVADEDQESSSREN